MRFRLTHRRFNNMLAWVVIALSLYMILLPFLPNISFWLKSRQSSNRTSIERQVNAPAPDSPKDDRLLIPSILVDEPIKTGGNIWVINDGGIWFRPNTKEPNTTGNTVLVGHRFTYKQPYGPLYHLDKVKVGDEIGLRWKEKTKTYVVEEIKIVSPDAAEVEAPSSDDRLTIYTCTPLLTAKDRLVIIAKEKR